MNTGSSSKKARRADTAVCVYGWQLLDGHIRSFINEIDGAKTAEDIEHIHQLRVFSRRISTTLRLFEKCFPGKTAVEWRKGIRKAARSLGEVRDLDVQIDFVQRYRRGLTDHIFLPGIKRLNLRLSQRRTRLQQITILNLEDLEKSGILSEIRTFLSNTMPLQRIENDFPAPLFKLAMQSIDKELVNLLSFEEIVFQPDKVEELHKMRIAAKNLRYSIEVFAPIYPDKLKQAFQAVRLTQEMLGSIHDLDVWKQFIPEFIQTETRRTEKYFGSTKSFRRLSPGLQQFEVHVSEKRDQTYTEFIQIWSEWKEDNLWECLKKSIRLPLGSQVKLPGEE